MITYCIRFFPAGGRRFYSDGTIGYRGISGLYWSSIASNTTVAWRIDFNYSGTYLAEGSRGQSMSVRCVALGR